MDNEGKYYIHNTAIADDGCIIGNNTKIWHWSHIMKEVVIGKGCNIGENVFIENGVKIGNNVKIKNNVAIYTGVECEDDVFLGPNCVFTNVINPRSFIERKSEFRKTIIHRGATIGANATIVCGNNIGQYAMVGAGSVVTHDVQDYCIVVGNPARFHSFVCRCGNKLNDNLKCSCGLSYEKVDGVIKEITQ